VGGSTLDGRTDQFAWGAVAYELLSGQSPWPPGEDLYALLSAIVRTKPAPLRSLRSDVPESVAAIVERALSKPREDRFGSMAEVAAAMGAAMAELSPSSLMSAVRSDLLSLPMASSTAPTLGADDVNAVTVEAAAIEVSARVSDPGRVSGPPSVRVAEGPATQRSGEVVPEREAVGERRARAGFWRAAQLLMVAAAASAAVWFFLTRGRPSEVASGETIANGCSEKAQRTYSSGTRALRNGDWQQARKHFQETVTADPECAAAHARLVVIGYWTDPPSRTRDELRRATDLREGLSERDRDLLHCYESVLWKAPPDEREFAACLDALSEARPRDAELAYIASDFSESPARMRELAQRALDIDPQYSDAWQGLAVALSLEEKETEALDALQKCVDKTVTSLDCLAQRALLQRRMGQCTELEGTARIWMTRSPQATGAHYTLASALAAQGRPRALVEEALVARWAHLAGSSDAREEPLEHAALDALFGDLAGARKRAQELFERSKGAADADERINAALWLLDLAVELGATEAAGALAEDLWNRKAAWDSASRHKGFNAKGATFEPQLLRVLSIAKRMAGEEIAKEQKRWIASVQAVSAPGAEGLWVLGSAIPAETPEAAAEAVRSMPASIVSSWSWTPKLPGLVTFAYAGRALLLAGRTDDAVRLLRRATAACAALEDPVLHTQAHLWLGQALAKKGEREAACAAFSVVTARWGQAAESLSARAAADESKALGCAP
ncbi:MAG: hypothetical protein R3F14_44025, partial [Polyangiaceae bacterium]